MTVHARGYRAHAGRFGGPPAFLTIARSGLGIAWRRKSFRTIGGFYLVWLAILTFVLYLAIGTDLGWVFRRQGAMFQGAELTLVILNEVLLTFYTGVAILTALLAIFVGAPLIADDLATGALPLHLVRPIRPLDYVIGKALVIPGILLAAALAPGLFFYGLAGFWQPPGEALAFLGAHLDVVGRVVEHYLVASAAYTGLVLLLSSRSARRGMVAVMAGSALFVGVMLERVAENARVEGWLGDALRLANLPRDTIAVFLVQSWSWMRRARAELPSASSIHLLAAALLLIGLIATWRRTRSVEITG